MTQLQISNKINQSKLIAKPFLKWVGGKTQLLGQFESLYPQELKEGKITKYFELFLGGGAVFFEIIQKYPIERAFLNDINQDLILAYKVVKNYPDELIFLLTELQNKYLQSNRQDRESIFYRIRNEYNQQRISFDYTKILNDSIKRVSWLIFLNKTCFNGLYRTNRKGDFNVPCGKYKNPNICNYKNIAKVAEYLQNITLMTGNYNNYSNQIDSKSFIYIDPPYRPINKTSSFTSYAKSGFNDRNQIELSQYYQYLSEESGAKVMLSNSNPHNTDLDDNFFHDLYRNYNIHEVYASRMVNSDTSKRGKISELVITNY